MNFKKNKVWFILLLIIITYLILYFIYPTKTIKAIHMFTSIIISLWYIFIIVFVTMVIIDYFLDPEIILKHMNTKYKFKIWLITITAGILSSGPVYVWFPLLKNLKEKGVTDRYLVAFLYNRAIKIPLLPIIIFYFSLKYVIILTTVMIIVSVIQGIIIEKITNKSKN